MIIISKRRTLLCEQAALQEGENMHSVVLQTV
ncbi:hypothetical protein EHW99_1568 [Erwinia amylovora]|uniref:Uncharacterized protein n=3 Tax=Erwinia amylovora TaxID=552 RepID=A0A831ESP5_ERWAM|nr:hypothetical protein EaACW_2030 [Erwinia amylovora ACW56400]QJQ54272.1 hypothetical protein EHX00_1568 [Erwinia amylovora]CBA20968.1 hypothetical protein predicted by Glimmer/Critica [Erwinia amylovora CFBP1430]CBX80892.1 hypothetical protein predicted by Glimmer/Critica [Erwinia amylovora ATCC BAA-2158]CCO78876.1 hypothetical protein BN432_2080 [Erwinia amylovora Ea356]CCO82674.1 hypothetical protein BN433_2105 [Erwinia amylovora Ea266]CCO86454.1 hypothetical protein BN434_2068 [Erwinia a